MHWESPSSTLLPCLLTAYCSLMAADPTPSSVQLLKCQRELLQTRQQSTESQHTLPSARAPLQPSSHEMRGAAPWRSAGSSLLGECTGALAHMQPHPALAGSSLLLSSSKTHPWVPAERSLLPTAPAKGLVQSCLARHKLTTSQAKKQESV